MPSIAVRNFGPIAHAEVDLKPLTVLIGSNNTGKSYLALAVYSLFQAVLRIRDQKYRPTRSRTTLKPMYVHEDSVQRVTNAGGDWNRIKPDVVKVISGAATFRNLPARIKESLRKESKLWTKVYSDYMAYELQRSSGSGMSQLERRDRQMKHDGLAIEVCDKLTGLSWNMRGTGNNLIVDRWEPNTSIMSESDYRAPLTSSSRDLDQERDLVDLLTTWYPAFLLRGYATPSHYLPAGRSAILQRHRTLAGLIVGQASTAWIESKQVDQMPGVIADFVQALLVLERTELRSGKIMNTVEFLESKVLAGSVGLERQHEYSELQYRSDLGQFNLHQVSSMVSEIAPLVLYLKYLVRLGHLCIIEEPESHLDPANQRLLARAIAMLVNAGVRILVTTHSDIVLNQINNLMQISGLAPRKRLRMGYKATEVLTPGDVSAYVFEPGDRGTQVTPLSVEGDYGISTASFDAVHRALYDEAVKMEHGR